MNIWAARRQQISIVHVHFPLHFRVRPNWREIVLMLLDMNHLRVSLFCFVAQSRLWCGRKEKEKKTFWNSKLLFRILRRSSNDKISAVTAKGRTKWELKATNRRPKCWVITMEELRRKTSLSGQLNPPQSSNPPLQRHQSLSEAERTYIFSTNAGDTQLNPNNSIPIGSGHSRSVSHGGGSVGGPLRPSLKSAMKGGHQRALSQGQIHDAPKSGHSRVGSKTDFILPPTHKDPDDTREPSSTASARGHSRQASRSESIYTIRREDQLPWWKRIPIFRRSKFEEHGIRQVVPNHTVPAKTPKRDHPNGKYVGNKIRTTKYTLLTFLPKNLMEQFHRVANLYFIFIQLLNWVPVSWRRKAKNFPDDSWIILVTGTQRVRQGDCNDAAAVRVGRDSNQRLIWGSTALCVW